jgi:hypothetical protein
MNSRKRQQFWAIAPRQGEQAQYLIDGARNLRGLAPTCQLTIRHESVQMRRPRMRKKKSNV